MHLISPVLPPSSSLFAEKVSMSVPRWSSPRILIRPFFLNAYCKQARLPRLTDPNTHFTSFFLLLPPVMRTPFDQFHRQSGAFLRSDSTSLGNRLAELFAPLSFLMSFLRSLPSPLREGIPPSSLSSIVRGHARDTTASFPLQVNCVT